MEEQEVRWTQDTWGIDTPEVAPRVSTLGEKLAWLGVFALAALAFELTADPALTTAVGCLKFGWDEVGLARWLKRTDPDRARGRICSRFYLAWGFWKIGAVAFAVMMIIVVAEEHVHQVGNPANRKPEGVSLQAFMGAGLMMIFGLVTTGIVSGFAVCSALRRKLRIWIGREANWAREQGVWPPQSVARWRDTRNHANLVVLSGIVLGPLCLLAPIVVVPVLLLLSWGGASDPLLLLVLASCIAVPAGGVALYKVVGPRVIAASPAECWS